MAGKIDIPKELTEKIEKYINEKRFKDFSDFFTQAAKLLLMAEDNKENFESAIKRM